MWGREMQQLPLFRPLLNQKSAYAFLGILITTTTISCQK